MDKLPEIDVQYKFEQTRLFPELNRTETRRNLAKIFLVYRRYKVLLKMQQPPDVVKVIHPAARGYENAMDPDLIRAPSPSGGGPPIGSEDRHTAWMRHFCADVEHTVEKLPSRPKREIVKRRFMSLEEPLPTDTEVWLSLRKDGMAMSERTYDTIKGEALALLAAAFQVEVDAK